MLGAERRLCARRVTINPKRGYFKRMMSPIHSFSEACTARRAVISEGLPVDRGPFSWDRTLDGGLDEPKASLGPAQPRIRVPHARGYGTLQPSVQRWIESLGSGTVFTCQQARRKVAGTPAQAKDAFHGAVKELTAAGQLERVSHGLYRRL